MLCQKLIVQMHHRDIENVLVSELLWTLGFMNVNHGQLEWILRKPEWNNEPISPIVVVMAINDIHTCFCTFRIASLAVVHKEQVLEENRVNVIARDAMITS